MDHVQRVAHSPPEAIERVHDDHVPLARVLQDPAQAGPVDRRPGLLVDVDPLARDTRVEERHDLSVEVLLGLSTRARVSQLHERERTGGRGRTAKNGTAFRGPTSGTRQPACF